jgi:hypothetical protein
LFVFSQNEFINLSYAHRCTQGGGVRGAGGYETAPPRQIFKKLVNKNAIKPKIGGPPQAIFPESLDPPRNFGKNIRYPLPWIFNPCASMLMPEAKQV